MHLAEHFEEESQKQMMKRRVGFRSHVRPAKFSKHTLTHFTELPPFAKNVALGDKGLYDMFFVKSF